MPFIWWQYSPRRDPLERTGGTGRRGTRASWFSRNCSSRASHACRLVFASSQMMSCSSTVMVSWSHESTTLSIRHQDGDGGPTRSARAYCRSVRRPAPANEGSGRTPGPTRWTRGIECCAARRPERGER
jgi:hypothetical protein